MIPGILLLTIVSISSMDKLPTFNLKHKILVESWLRKNPDFRVAIERDCGDCLEEITAIRRGMGGQWKAIPNYHPYYMVGDFNGDGVEDFAFVAVSKNMSKKFKVIIFNGPFTDGADQAPSFISNAMNMSGNGLFFGPPRPKPYRLIVGGFESEGRLLLPKGAGYVLK